MPRKTARSGSQTPLGRSEMSRAIHPLASGLPASSENAYHPRQFRVHLGEPRAKALSWQEREWQWQMTTALTASSCATCATSARSSIV
jgi:hypothetical protein